MLKDRITKRILSIVLTISLIFGLVISNNGIIFHEYSVKADESDNDINIGNLNITDDSEDEDDSYIDAEDVPVEEPVRIVVYIDTDADKSEFVNETYVQWVGPGSGTEDDPYLISTVDDLIQLQQNVNAGDPYIHKVFKMTNNIDLSSVCNESSGVSWTPIGYYNEKNKAQSLRFKGIFDGGGYSISGLYIKANANVQGLFGYVAGEVKNLTVRGNIECTDTNKYVGGIAAVLIEEESYLHLSGVLSNCSFNGNVTGGEFTGGLVGFSEGVITNCITIKGSEITGCGKTGGIVGYINKSIYDCTNNASVSNSDKGNADYVGGIAGICDFGEVTNCLNTGVITNLSSLYTGGILGAYYGLDDPDFADIARRDVFGNVIIKTIKDCTNKGNIIAGDYSGGIAGYTLWCNISNCVNDGNIVNWYSKYRGGIVGATEKTPIIEYCTNNAWIKGSYCFGGIVGYYSGKVDRAFLMETTEQYLERYKENARNEGVSEEDIEQYIEEYKREIMFKYSKDARVISYNEYDELIPYEYKNYNFGLITQCVNTGRILGRNWGFGGIAGKCDKFSNVTDCTNTGFIYTFSNNDCNSVGGIVGKIDKYGSIYSCLNSYDIRMPGFFVGGIAGESYSSIGECTNTGDIYSENYMGGICGYAKNITIDTCFNYGKIEAYESDDGCKNQGGIVGNANRATVSKCQNKGDVYGFKYVAGIIGGTTESKIQECFNYGNITATCPEESFAGGITGRGEKVKIYKCANKGDITGYGSMVGGIVGQLWLKAINKTFIIYDFCKTYNRGHITGSDNIGGLVGYVHSYYSRLFMNECYDYSEKPTLTNGSNWGKLIGYADDTRKDWIWLQANIFTNDNWNPVSWDPLKAFVTFLDSSHGLIFYDRYHYLTNKEMGDLNSFKKIGWVSDWQMGSDAPVLKAENELNKKRPGICGLGGTGGSGGNGNVLYHLSSKDDLIEFREYVNSGITYEGLTVRLDDDIDLTGVAWEPIGVSGNYFAGSFDGQGHAITGLSVNTGEQYDASGLFGSISGETEIKNLYVSGNVKGAGLYVGGIVGTANGLIDSCFFEGDVTGTTSNIYGAVGGIVGSSSYCTIQNCGHDGIVKSTNDVAGGIVGKKYASATIDSCFHYGDKNSVLTNNGSGTGGGIAGDANGEEIYSSFCIAELPIVGTDDYYQSNCLRFNSLEDFKDPAKMNGWFFEFDISDAAGSVWGVGSKYPCLQIASINVTLAANNNTGEVRTFWTHKAHKVLPDCLFNYPGYEFIEWNTEPDGTGTVYADHSAINGGEKLYAQWAPITYTLTIDSSGYYPESKREEEIIYYTVESDYELPVLGRDLEYTFTGWRAYPELNENTLEFDNTNWEYEKIYEGGTLLTGKYGNVKLYASWYKKTSFKVTFIDIDGTVISSADYHVGAMSSDIVMPEMPSVYQGTKYEGYTLEFDKWSSEIGDVDYIDEDVTYVANYTIKTNTLTYYYNDGTGTIVPQTVYYGVEDEISDFTLTKRGYTFTGWNTEIDGSGDTYSNMSNITVTSDTDLYAQWKPNEITVLDISDVMYSGNPICPIVTVKDGDDVLVLDTDYTVDYINNNVLGTATVQVTGKGDYADRVVTKTFVILGEKYDTPDEPELESKTQTSITLKSNDGYEYKCGDGDWQQSNVFTNLTPGTEYSFYQRKKGDTTHEASESSLIALIKTEDKAVEEPTGTETQEPTGTETQEPTGAETQEPSGTETQEPTGTETQEPTGTETQEPTGTETQEPTGTETQEPTGTETQEPTGTETQEPTGTETQEPTGTEPQEPAGTETQEPTGSETQEPTGSETQEPTGTETQEPTGTETQEPTGTETQEPTGTETQEPTSTETQEPTSTETQEPTGTETQDPTGTETQEPSGTETQEPTGSETQEPTGTETQEPTGTETQEPSGTETQEPTSNETQEPTSTETQEPTGTETQESTGTETQKPTETETQIPTAPIITEPSVPKNTTETVTDKDGSKTTIETTYSEDKSKTVKSLKENTNGNKATKITFTDKDGKDLITASEIVNTSKNGTQSVITNITEADGYHYYNEVKTTKSNKETVVTEITNADKSSLYAKMTTSPEGNVVRNCISIDSNGVSIITFGTYNVSVSSSTDNLESLNTIKSIKNLVTDTDGFKEIALPEKTETVTEMTYKVTSGKTAKLTKCITTENEITIPSKVIINGKSYNVVAVSKNAFKGCDSLTKVTLGKTITTIGTKAFADLESLSEIVFNSKSKDGIKIGKGAFNGIAADVQFFMKAKKDARTKTAKRIKNSGYGSDVVILKK